MTVYAPLFSHESDPTPQNVFTERDAAAGWGRTVCAAQPGIEVELMVQTGPAGWRSEASGETVAEVRARRWQGPVPNAAVAAWEHADWRPIPEQTVPFRGTYAGYRARP